MQGVATVYIINTFSSNFVYFQPCCTNNSRNIFIGLYRKWKFLQLVILKSQENNFMNLMPLQQLGFCKAIFTAHGIFNEISSGVKREFGSLR